MRIVFMGSPMLAVPPLRALVQAGHQILLVVTQPDQPAGRGRQPAPPPVARAADALGIPQFQPERVRQPEALERIRETAPDLIVVAAYGQILPPALLSIPRYGCVNVHPSLLPRHRGAAPISAALLAGDLTTGVSIMLMDAGMDTGPVLSAQEVPIHDEDDQVTLTERLAQLGAELLIPTIDRWVAGQVQPVPQDEARATVTRRTTRADGALVWAQAAVDLWRRVRAFAEWPQAFTHWNGRLLRIRSTHVSAEPTTEPGRVIPWDATSRRHAGAAVGTGRGVLVLDVVGLEGRRLLPIDEFLRGQPTFIGARLGE